MLRIDAPHFVAGISFNEREIADRAAPILRWMIGKRLAWVQSYCASKGWIVEVMP